MADHIIRCESIHVNLSPDLFRKAAKELLEAAGFLAESGKFSTVPFFLYGRAMELSLKGKLLETRSQPEVRGLVWHDLEKAYELLASEDKTLTPTEQDILAKTNEIYRAKEFEYLTPSDAAMGYKRFPDLQDLAALARRLVDA